ncbi:MAG: tRNA pseudouridine(38-40) synthase TruA, partial [Clostridia bacterium]|nr:tRNA pseudouridine(38-40) synthase TruA [Clostridia bacterium]
MRIKITLSYDGTDFCGWQKQKNGISVQKTVEGAVFNLTGEKLTVTASGRTDAGVHAKGQVAHFDT